MQVSSCAIAEVKLITPNVFGDNRGFFFESYSHSIFSKQGIPDIFVQDNHSKSAKGTLRGLHFQKPPKAQAKLVRVVKGCIFDVAVDIRPQSATYKQWVGVELSEDNKQMLYIPDSFAHGFYVLSDVAEVIYKCTDYYSPNLEGSILWNDPSIGIQWPKMNEQSVILSERDRQATPLV